MHRNKQRVGQGQGRWVAPEGEKYLGRIQRVLSPASYTRALSTGGQSPGIATGGCGHLEVRGPSDQLSDKGAPQAKRHLVKVSVGKKGRHLTKRGRKECVVMEDLWGQSPGPELL